MDLLVASRKHLLPNAPQRRLEALLLEGSWPEGGRSLDDAIDARYAWIDEAAASWAERLGASCASAWLDALALRYYLVKLLRVVAYFTDIQSLAPGDCVTLLAQRARDEDYADLLGQLSRHARASCRVQWIERPPQPAPTFPPNPVWRRAAAWLRRGIEPRVSGGAECVVLCGNPRVLDPVGQSLRGRGCRLWWLYDRFAFRAWLRWRPRGAGQLTCDSSLGRSHGLAEPVIGHVQCRGVDLAGSLQRWITQRSAFYGPRWSRLLDQIDRHFCRVRPAVVVLDEDATPLARAAVAMARRHGAASLVVQHGAPCCRFGFAPLAADRILVWNEPSAKQLVRWDVPPERITVVGLPKQDPLYGRLGGAARVITRRAVASTGAAGAVRILLLATVPPRDDRPDAIALHMTRRSYAEMLCMALATLAKIPHVRLVVKFHPRAPRDPILEGVLAQFPSLSCSTVRTGAMEMWLRQVDCVLSCGSSAGVEAAQAGLPVIQILPAGSGEVLEDPEWGILGTARNPDQLQLLLSQALAVAQADPIASRPKAAGQRAGSAERIADVILQTARVSAVQRPIAASDCGLRSSGACPARIAT